MKSYYKIKSPSYKRSWYLYKYTKDSNVLFHVFEKTLWGYWKVWEFHTDEILKVKGKKRRCLLKIFKESKDETESMGTNSSENQTQGHQE